MQSARWGELLGVLDGCDHWALRGARGLDVDLPALPRALPALPLPTADAWGIAEGRGRAAVRSRVSSWARGGVGWPDGRGKWATWLELDGGEGGGRGSSLSVGEPKSGDAQWAADREPSLTGF